MLWVLSKIRINLAKRQVFAEQKLVDCVSHGIYLKFRDYVSEMPKFAV